MLTRLALIAIAAPRRVIAGALFVAVLAAVFGVPAAATLPGGGFLDQTAESARAAAILGEERLLGISQKLTDTGDQWRAFASQGARCCKGRAKEGDSFPALAALMRDCGRREGEIYAELAGVAAVHARRLRL